MKLIDRYEFANGKSFETYYLDAEDAERHKLPECDVIGFTYDDTEHGTRLLAMRPDEALIQAQMLIAAVNKTTSRYEIKLYESYNGERKEAFRAESKPLALELLEDLQEADHATSES